MVLKPITQVPIRFLNPTQILSQLDIKEGMTVADLGCGSGFLTLVSAKLVGTEGVVYAVDIQKSVISELRSKIKLYALRNIKPIRANLEILGQTKIADESVDFTLIVHVLHQTNKRKEILKEAKRMLKFKGKALIIDWKKTATPIGPPVKIRVDKETVRQEAEEIGLKYLNDIKTDEYHFGFLMEKV